MRWQMPYRKAEMWEGRLFLLCAALVSRSCLEPYVEMDEEAGWRA